MKRIDKIKSINSEFIGVVDVFTQFNQQVNFIDVENNIIEFTTTTSPHCSPFNQVESFQEDLSEFIEGMEEDDFIELLNEIDCAC